MRKLLHLIFVIFGVVVLVCCSDIDEYITFGKVKKYNTDGVLVTVNEKSIKNFLYVQHLNDLDSLGEDADFYRTVKDELIKGRLVRTGFDTYTTEYDDSTSSGCVLFFNGETCASVYGQYVVLDCDFRAELSNDLYVVPSISVKEPSDGSIRVSSSMGDYKVTRFQYYGDSALINMNVRFEKYLPSIGKYLPMDEMQEIFGTFYEYTPVTFPH